MADCPYGAMLRPARYRIDGRGVGTAINHSLNHLWSFDSCSSDAIEDGA